MVESGIDEKYPHQCIRTPAGVPIMLLGHHQVHCSQQHWVMKLDAALCDGKFDMTLNQVLTGDGMYHTNG